MLKVDSSLSHKAQGFCTLCVLHFPPSITDVGATFFNTTLVPNQQNASRYIGFCRKYIQTRVEGSTILSDPYTHISSFYLFFILFRISPLTGTFLPSLTPSKEKRNLSTIFLNTIFSLPIFVSPNRSVSVFSLRVCVSPLIRCTPWTDRSVAGDEFRKISLFRA